MNKTLKILPPTMPNFFRYETEPGRRQDGVRFNEGISIATFNEEEAQEFAEMMKQEFIKHWRLKKSQTNQNEKGGNG